MRGWMAQCAKLLDPLYRAMKKELFGSKVIGTDDTRLKCSIASFHSPESGGSGLMWAMRIIRGLFTLHAHAIAGGPAKFLEGYKGYLQANAYSVYDAFFKGDRGMIEVGCWMHAGDTFYKALESDQRMGPALHLITRVYAVEDRAKALALSAEQRLALRKRVSVRLMEKLHNYLLELKTDVLPRSPSGAGCVCAESMGSADALSRRRRSGNRQRRQRASESGTSRWDEATGHSSEAITVAERRRY